jgi:hypothetical protein
MWMIVPALLCVVGMIVAFLPPADPLGELEVDPARSWEPRAAWLPSALMAVVTVAVLTLALRAVFTA